MIEKDTIISTKIAEIHAMEKYYMKYLEKAKMVLRQMDPNNTNSVYNQEMQSLHKKLNEKHRKLKFLKVNIFVMFFRIEFNICFIERIRK